jgi:hypothetical protein
MATTIKIAHRKHTNSLSIAICINHAINILSTDVSDQNAIEFNTMKLKGEKKRRVNHDDFMKPNTVKEHEIFSQNPYFTRYFAMPIFNESAKKHQTHTHTLNVQYNEMNFP